jgi:hypothetical protein
MEASHEQLELSLGSREHTNNIIKGKGSKLVIRGTGVRTCFNVYECKTCNKVFPKFQALGGHTTSHKKSRALGIAQDDGNNNSTNKKHKLHGCSICGFAYTTGQALGGHMTRHRAPVGIATSSKPKALKPYKPIKKRNALPLDFDLNLAAAPEDEQRKSKFALQTNKSCLLCTSIDALSLP